MVIECLFPFTNFQHQVVLNARTLLDSSFRLTLFSVVNTNTYLLGFHHYASIEEIYIYLKHMFKHAPYYRICVFLKFFSLDL